MNQETFPQYCARRKSEALADFPELTTEQFTRWYPPHSLKTDYRAHIYELGRDGHKLTLPVCRSIVDVFGAEMLPQLQRFYRCVPENVLFATGKVI